MSDPMSTFPELKEFLEQTFGPGLYPVTGNVEIDRPSGQALVDILRERRRQDALKAEGAFTYTCADLEMTDTEKYCVLGEEFGEAGRAVLAVNKLGTFTDYGGMNGAAARKQLRKELVQCAAVAMAWIEALDRAEVIVPEAPGPDF